MEVFLRGSAKNENKVFDRLTLIITPTPKTPLTLATPQVSFRSCFLEHQDTYWVSL